MTFNALLQMLSGKGPFNPTEGQFSFTIPAHASKTIYNDLIAPFDMVVTGIQGVVNTAQGGALTATFSKATSTTTPASGTTPLHSGTFNANGTAHTVQALTLTTTAADLYLAAGDRLATILSAALTTGDFTMTVKWRRSH